MSGIPTKFVVVCQRWYESERGWGGRPDGYSLHITGQDRREYIDAYWATMPDHVPDIYSRPDGEPYACEVDNALHETILHSNQGVRLYGRAPNDLTR